MKLEPKEKLMRWMGTMRGRSDRRARRRLHGVGGWVVVGLSCIAFACSSSRPAANGGKGKAVAHADDNACDHICAASAACGDSPETCEPKCNDWLVKRSRPGIATAAARCAVPRIDMACEQSASSKGAASALVACIDEAGRAALQDDNSSLLVAARAICERGARCSGNATQEDAERCVTRITVSGKVPRGLGIFGAIKPEIVQRFASCMEEAECGPESGASACFGEMLGDGKSGGPKKSSPKKLPPSSSPESGTKI